MRILRVPHVAVLAVLLTACGDKSNPIASSDTMTSPGSDSATGDESTGNPSVTTGPGPMTMTTLPNPSDPTTTGPDPTGSEEDTNNFIQLPDGGDGGECDAKVQDCPEGEKCTAVTPGLPEPWGINKCVPVMGDGQVGDPCDVMDGKYTGLDNCDVGLICLLTDDDGNGGACVEFCNVNDVCPVTGAECVSYNSGSMPICLADCDPLIQDCPEGQGCYNSAGDSFVCFKVSAMPGEGGPGDECSYINQCQKGSFCANTESVVGCNANGGCCTPYCPVSGGDEPCQEGEQCVPFFAMGQAKPGYEDVGICAIPE